MLGAAEVCVIGTSENIRGAVVVGCEGEAVQAAGAFGAFTMFGNAYEKRVSAYDGETKGGTVLGALGAAAAAGTPASKHDAVMDLAALVLVYHLLSQMQADKHVDGGPGGPLQRPVDSMAEAMGPLDRSVEAALSGVPLVDVDPETHEALGKRAARWLAPQMLVVAKASAVSLRAACSAGLVSRSQTVIHVHLPFKDVVQHVRDRVFARAAAGGSGGAEEGDAGPSAAPAAADAAAEADAEAEADTPLTAPAPAGEAPTLDGNKPVSPAGDLVDDGTAPHGPAAAASAGVVHTETPAPPEAKPEWPHIGGEAPAGGPATGGGLFGIGGGEKYASVLEAANGLGAAALNGSVTSPIGEAHGMAVVVFYLFHALVMRGAGGAASCLANVYRGLVAAAGLAICVPTAEGSDAVLVREGTGLLGKGGALLEHTAYSGAEARRMAVEWLATTAKVGPLDPPPPEPEPAASAAASAAAPSSQTPAGGLEGLAAGIAGKGFAGVEGARATPPAAPRKTPPTSGTAPSGLFPPGFYKKLFQTGDPDPAAEAEDNRAKAEDNRAKAADSQSKVECESRPDPGYRKGYVWRGNVCAVESLD